MAVSEWASFMASWFTPTSLFLVLNLTIGTIFLLTRFGTHKTPPQLGPPHHDSPQLARASSLLDRVKSINFSLYKFDPPEHHHLPEPQHSPRIERSPSLLERLKSINLLPIDNSSRPDRLPEPEANHQDPSPEPVHDHGVKRSKSESAGATSAPAEKMTRSASENSEKSGGGGGGGEEEEEEEKEEIAVVEKRRPATAPARERERSVNEAETAAFSEDDGVDAKADDFINRFKQQLKLQRLESLKRFSEMWKGK